MIPFWAIVMDAIREARARYFLPIFISISVTVSLSLAFIGYRGPDDPDLVRAILEDHYYPDWTFIADPSTGPDGRVSWVAEVPTPHVRPLPGYPAPRGEGGLSFAVEPRAVLAGGSVTVRLITGTPTLSAVVSVDSTDYPVSMSATGGGLFSGEATIPIPPGGGGTIPIVARTDRGEGGSYGLPVVPWPSRHVETALTGAGADDVRVAEEERVGASPVLVCSCVIRDRTRIGGRTDVTVSFTSVEVPVPASVRETVAGVQYTFAEYIFGIGAILIAVILTAGMVPAMLEEGRVAVYLAHPISRPVLLLGKYAGAVLFVFINSVILVSGCFLVMSIRSGVWNWGFLLTAATTTLVFAIVYPVSMLFGVLLRNGIASVLFAVTFWFVCQIPTYAMSFLGLRVADPDPRERVEWAALALYWILPKTRDLAYLNTYFCFTGQTTPAVAEAIASEMEIVSLPLSVGTSVAFAAAVLAAAIFWFSRRDI